MCTKTMTDVQRPSGTTMKTKSKEEQSSSIILATSESRFCEHSIPSCISYILAFVAFPLNMMAGSCALFIYCIFFSDNTYARMACLLYLAWMILIDRKRCDGIGYPTSTKEPFKTMRHWVRNNWLYGIHNSYYPIRLHKLAELPAENNNEKCKYLFTCHPHGVMGVGTMATFATDEVGFKKLYPGVDTHMTGLRQVFYTPLFRDWCMLGGIMSADKTSFQHIFQDKQASAALNLGGAAEAFIGLDTNPKTGNKVMKLLLKDRKGFCKLALTHGVSLVPVISFEEHLIFDLYRFPTTAGYKLQLYLQKHVLGFAPLLMMGNKWPLMPKRNPLNVFVGKPIACPKSENPTSEQINAKHKEYCDALETMFHQCKALVPGCENWELEFIEHPFKSVSA